VDQHDQAHIGLLRSRERSIAPCGPREIMMPTRYVRTAVTLVVLLGATIGPATSQAPATTPRKPVLIVSGTAVGFAGPAVPLVEELVIHNDGLVTLETTAATEKCRALRRFARAAEVEKLRTDLLAAGAFEQGDFLPGQTADLPDTTVTLFRGIPGTRLDLSSSFTYERVPQLPQRIAAIRARIQTFVESVFTDFKTDGCPFPF
jgi:hypothetical protein